MKNAVQLIVYPDSLGGDLKTLSRVLKKYFQESIGGVHILPFYPSSSDRGFSPLTHLHVDERFGNWENIGEIACDFDLIVDMMINHVSQQSSYFQDYLSRGSLSFYKDFFLDEETFFEGMGRNEHDLKLLYRPRPESPFREFILEDGKRKNIFCTFSRDQIDLNIENSQVRKLFLSFMDQFERVGVDMVRLDAVGYSIKRRGTSSFMLKETRDNITWFGEQLHNRGITSLPEVHQKYDAQIQLASQEGVDYVYDFNLPLLVLYTLFFGDAKPLKRWIAIRPTNAITTLDTHDGIGVVDVEGLLDEKLIKKTLQLLRVHGGNALLRATGTQSDNVDIYQINVTYYSALGESDEGYLIARALQFFIPGIPQVYYVGALAGSNDAQKVERTNIGRDINRHDYTEEEIQQAFERKIVRDLRDLMKFRSTYEAFDGTFSSLSSNDAILKLRWEEEDLWCELFVDLHSLRASIEYIDQRTKKKVQKILCESVKHE